jgi:hypothetical protein
MGVQSVDEEYKRKTLLRMERDDHLRRSLEALRDVGLEAKLDHILGLPGEPRSAQEEARKLYVEFAPRRVQTFWLTYVPGIELTKQALADGVLTQADVDEIERGKTRIFRHPHLAAPQREARLGEAGQGSERGHDASGAEPTDDASDFYQRYDVLFRMLPFLPQALRRRLRPEHLPHLGEKAASAVGFAFDLANALRRIDRETLIFAKHYGRQTLKQLPELLFGRAVALRTPAVRPRIVDPRRLPVQEMPDEVSGRPKRVELRVV